MSIQPKVEISHDMRSGGYDLNVSMHFLERALSPDEIAVSIHAAVKEAFVKQYGEEVMSKIKEHLPEIIAKVGQELVVEGLKNVMAKDK